MYVNTIKNNHNVVLRYVIFLDYGLSSIRHQDVDLSLVIFRKIFQVIQY